MMPSAAEIVDSTGPKRFLLRVASARGLLASDSIDEGRENRADEASISLRHPLRNGPSFRFFAPPPTISEREEARTAKFKVEMSEKDEELERMRAETVELRSMLKAQSLRHQLEIEEQRRQYKLMKARLEQMGEDMKDQFTLGEYCRMIKEAAPQRTDTQYVIKLQAQMAKALNEMGVMGNQLTALKQSCDGVVKNLHKEMAKIVHDKSNAEQEFMNEFFNLEKNGKEARNEFEKKLQQNKNEIEELRKELCKVLAPMEH